MSKDQILGEITSNGSRKRGKPPGWRQFAPETGIREADWLGKLWEWKLDRARHGGRDGLQAKEVHVSSITWATTA